MRTSCTIDSPVGPLTLTARDGRLAAVDYGTAGDGGGHDPLLAEAARQFRAYFEGRLTEFDLPLAPPVSPFQARVRAAMQAIPFGAVASYGGLAVVLGTSPRAIGNACGRNPLTIVVPCHRVLARGGTIGGYSGGRGLDTKRWLLRHEGWIRAG